VKKTEKCKDTSVAINVKENKKFQEISAPKTPASVSMSTFSSGLLPRHFWDVNTPIFTQNNAKKMCVASLTQNYYHKILRRIFCHRRKHKHYLSTLVFVTP